MTKSWTEEEEIIINEIMDVILYLHNLVLRETPMEEMIKESKLYFRYAEQISNFHQLEFEALIRIDNMDPEEWKVDNIPRFIEQAIKNVERREQEKM